MGGTNVLKEIVHNGSNLTLSSGVGDDVLRDLASLAHKSGAQITVHMSKMGDDMIQELSRKYGKAISFIY